MRINRWLAIPAAAALLAAGATAPATAAPARVSAQDRMFLKQNAQTDMAEVTLGKYMLQHTNDQQVRDFARDVVKDHQKALDRVRKLAQQLNVVLPNGPNAMQLAGAQKVMNSTAQARDRRYASTEVTGHQMSISDTRRELNNGSDHRVVSFARTYLPVAQEHLRHARKLP
jgi:putative membrane protein